MRALFLALAVVVSLVPLWPVYQTPAFIVAVVVGGVLGALIALVSARRSWSVLATVLATVGAYLLVGVPVAIPSQALFGILPTLQGELSLITAVVLSWKQLVTVMPPVGSYEALLVPAFILSLCGVLLATVLSLRLPRNQARSNWAAVVPLLTLGTSIWLGPSRSFASIVVTVGVFVLIALWFAAGRSTNTRAGFRSLGVVVLAAVVASAIVVVVPITNRSVWRTEIEQPFVLQDDTSPLSEYRNYVTGDQQSAELLTVTGLEAGQRLSLATLDNYTGVLYSVGGVAADFTKIPGSLPVDSSSGQKVSAEITIDQLTGPWVPLPGALGSLSFTGSNARSLTDSFYYSRPSQTGALITGLVAGDSYTTVAHEGEMLNVDVLASLTPGDAIVPAPAVIPDGLDAFVATTAKGKTSAGERLQASLTALMTEGYISHGGPGEVPSASGHGANRIAALFAATPMVGDAEQYSTAAALIATQLGFPARVVMGFIAPEGSSAQSALTFTGADMTAWIEVSTHQGWVAINPNPAERPIPDEQPQDPTEVAFPQTAADPPAQEEPQLNDSASAEAAQEEQPNTVDPVLQTVLAIVSGVAWTLLWLGILASPLLSIVFLKRRRRNKRFTATTSQEQVLGAWDELRDVLVDNGTTAPASNTRREIAEETGIHAATAVAVLADAAQYSGEKVSETEARSAWAEVDLLSIEIARERTRWQRFQARISLRSFNIPWARLTSWLPKRR